MKLYILILLALFLVGCQYQKGISRDTIYGYDSGLIWGHLYLTNDHSTAYCFDVKQFNNILQTAKDSNKKIEVTYSKNIGKGVLCSVGDYERVIVEDVKILD
jgi:hypothetical protein